MKAKTTTLALLLLGLLAASVAGALDWDWGGTLDNATALALTPSFRFDQRDKLALWVEAQLDPTFTLFAQGSYLISYDSTADPSSIPYVLDVDYLNLEIDFGPGMTGTAGRQTFSDFTGHILNHTLDGMQLRFDLLFMVMRLGIGGSGLLLKPTSTILMSNSDGADQTDEQVHFAAPRLIQTVSVLLPQLFLRQDLTLSALMQLDLRPASELIQEGEEEQSPADLYGGWLDSQYFGLGLSGPIVASLYYDSFIYLETGKTLSYLEDSGSMTLYSYQYKPILAFMAGVGVKYYLEKALSSRIELRGLFTSGDSDNATFLEGNTAGSSTLFVPISQQQASLVFAPKLGNLALVQAEYSLKPLESLQALVKALVFLRPTAGAISEPGLTTGSDATYLGTEIDGVVNFRPYSDLGLAFSLGTFLPSASAFASAEPRFTGRIEISVSF